MFRPDPSNPAASRVSSVLPRWLLWLMAFASGVNIANIYYNQPLLEQIGRTFGSNAGTTGWVPTLTLLGYASGVLFLIPLGDMVQRRVLVVLATLLSACTTLAIAFAPRMEIVIGLSYLLGLFAMTPQLLVPFAAQLASPEAKGRVIGFMVSGSLMGVAAARIVAGLVGEHFGWRVMYIAASVMLVMLAAALARLLPRTRPTYTGSYSGLLRGVAHMVKTQPVLREACIFGAMFFGSFMCFWSNLIHLLESSAYGLGPREAGLFGLVGAITALLCPSIGAFADRRDARRLTGTMIGVSIASYAIIFGGGLDLFVLALGVLVMDLGVQLGHVANQGRIFRLDPDAQSRIQTAYMFAYFAGGSAGAALGGWGWAHYGWAGVCSISVSLLLVGAVRWLWRHPLTGDQPKVTH